MPPANGASKGNYFQAKMAVFEAKTGLTKTAAAPKRAKLFCNGFPLLNS